MSQLRELASLPTPDSELSPADETLLAKMTQHAYIALLTVQPPTWAEYFQMDWLERAAVNAARRRIRAEDAQRFGLASTGILGAALAGADGDGGNAAAEVYVAQQTAQALANIEAETAAAHVQK